MTSLLHSIAELLTILAIGAASLVGFQPAEQTEPGVGGVQVAADFSSSLVSSISVSATTMTLVSTSTPSGEHLVQGQTYGFKLGGREYVIGTLSAGRQITSMTRGLSLITGTTTSGVAEPWGRGTAVEITDAPILIQLAQQASGRQGFDAPVFYDAGVSTSSIAADERNIPNVALLNYTAFNGAGVINASTIAKGVVELATGAEAAASTANGATGVLALPASLATSTRNAATAANVIPVTGLGGKIDDNFLALATSTLYATPVGFVGKNAQVITSTGTSTFAIPAGVTHLQVTVVGAGGGGGSCDPASTDEGGGSGGGGGGTAIETVNVSGTTTVQLFVGTGGTPGVAGTWSTFGTNGFYLSATGGSFGPTGEDGTLTGGAGGVGAGGDLNISGQGGGAGQYDGDFTYARSGGGGSSHLGGGASAVAMRANVGTLAGINGGNYGGGGSGAACAAGVSGTGGTGANGVVIVRW